MSIEDELHTRDSAMQNKSLSILPPYMLRVWGSLLKFGFPLLISLKNAHPHSTIACNVSYFQYLKGCKAVL